MRAPQPRLTQRDALTSYELWSSVDGTRTPALSPVGLPFVTSVLGSSHDQESFGDMPSLLIYGTTFFDRCCGKTNRWSFAQYEDQRSS